MIRLLEVFESQKHLLMVMEYAGGGDLLKLIKKRGGLKEQDSKFIFKQIAYGLSHIHCRSVIHRDIKPANVVLDASGRPVLTDFDISDIKFATKLSSVGAPENDGLEKPIVPRRLLQRLVPRAFATR